MSSYSLLACGSNAQGQLANGTQDDALTFNPCLFTYEGADHRMPPVGTQAILRVAGGANHTLVLLEIKSEQNQLWVCGDNSVGQLNFSGSIRDETGFVTLRRVLAIPSIENESLFEIVDVAAAWQTSYLVLRASHAFTSDIIVSCGSNEFGARGVKSSDSAPSVINFHHLCAPEETQNCHVEVGNIVCGPRHVVAVLHVMSYGHIQRRMLMGWGACRHGQLGSRKETDGAKNRPLSFLPEPAKVCVPHEEEDPIVSVAAGSRHTLVLHISGRVTFLGSDRFGQTSAVREWTGITSIGCTWNSSYAIGVYQGLSKLYCVGSNDHGQLGSTDTASHYFEHDLGAAVNTNISPGSEHVLLLRSSRQTQLEGWGWNEHGNLGLGHTTDVMEPTIVMGFGSTISNPSKAWAGCGTTWVLVHGPESSLPHIDQKV